jgi:hypothetical protein
MLNHHARLSTGSVYFGNIFIIAKRNGRAQWTPPLAWLKIKALLGGPQKLLVRQFLPFKFENAQDHNAIDFGS